MKRVAVGAHLPTPRRFERAKRPDDGFSKRSQRDILKKMPINFLADYFTCLSKKSFGSSEVRFRDLWAHMQALRRYATLARKNWIPTMKYFNHRIQYFKPHLHRASSPSFPRRVFLAMPFSRSSAWKTRRRSPLKLCMPAFKRGKLGAENLPRKFICTIEITSARETRRGKLGEGAPCKCGFTW